MQRKANDWNCLVFLVLSGTFGLFAVSAAARSLLDWADVLNLGATFSVYSYGQAPYNRAAPFLDFDERILFSTGSEAFAGRRVRSTEITSGIFSIASANAQSCESCHFKDGRGRAHASDLDSTGFSAVDRRTSGFRAIFRKPASADVESAWLSEVRWTTAKQIVLSGGETVELVKPVAIVDGVERLVDLRNAPGIFGLGLLESIPETDIIAYAGARFYGQFGIAGLVPIATSRDISSPIGRFGWKGSHATLFDQVSDAVNTELGIVPKGELHRSGLEAREFAALTVDLTNYLRLLAVPARRLDSGGAHKAGAKLFIQIGCSTCHKPSWTTGGTADVDEKLRGLLIYPFTDMLLHDMGPDLSDPAGSNLSSYWRTAPLWGIGVQDGVSKEVGFLHDGRARTLVEAILWHGGEGQRATELFKALSPKERTDLIIFLSSL